MINYVDILVLLTFFSVFIIKSIIMKFCFKKSFSRDFLKKENVIGISVFLFVFILAKCLTKI